MKVFLRFFINSIDIAVHWIESISPRIFIWVKNGIKRFWNAFKISFHSFFFSFLCRSRKITKKCGNVVNLRCCNSHTHTQKSFSLNSFFVLLLSLEQDGRNSVTIKSFVSDKFCIIALSWGERIWLIRHSVKVFDCTMYENRFFFYEILLSLQFNLHWKLLLWSLRVRVISSKILWLRLIIGVNYF